MNKDILLALGVMGLTDQWSNDMYRPALKGYWKIDPPRKCALPGCDNVTTRGYCCAEHCEIHKRKFKVGKR